MPFINAKYPLRIGSAGYFATNDTLEDAVKEDIRHVIMTNKGERVMMPEYGSDVIKMLFEPLTESSKAKLNSLISEAIKRWVPKAHLIWVAITVKEDLSQKELVYLPLDTHTILVTISYSVIMSKNVTSDAKTLNLMIRSQ